MQRFVFAVLLSIVSAGCGAAPVSNDPFGRQNRSVLLEDEIRAAKGFGWTAYDLINQLRPEYLRTRGAVSLRNVVVPTATVYLDGAKYGDVQSLKLINGEHVSRVQYLNGSEATTRYGTDHGGGAILITTK